MNLHKKVLSLLLLSLIVSSCATEKEATYTIPAKESTFVWSGEVVENSAYIWYTESTESSNIGSKTPGRIINMTVQKGDRVKAGQVLAVIDAQEAKENYSSALSVLSNTESVYANTSSLFDAQIASMKTKVEQAQNNIELAEASLKWTTTGLSDTENSSDEWLKTVEKQVEQSELALDTTKTQYEHTKALLDQKEKDVYLNAQNTLNSASILAASLLEFTDTLYGASDKNKYVNDAFESNFCADYSIRTKWEFLWLQNQKDYTTWKKKIDNLGMVDISTDAGKIEIQTTLTESQKFFESLRDFSNLTHSCLEASIAGTNFTTATIAGYKTQLNTLQSSLENSLLSVNGNFIVGIKWSIQNIGNLTNERTLQLSLLEKQIKLAEKANEVAKQNYAQYKSWTTGKINEVTTKTNIAKSQLDIAKKQYDEAKSWMKALEKQKDMQLSTITTQMANISGNKDLANIAVNGATVLSPFDWVITDKFASVWQIVGSGLPIFSVARDEKVKIKVLLGENEIGTLKVWNEANVVFGDNGKAIVWKIKVIQPFSDTLSKKIPVEIWLDNADRKIILGSYADVSFKTTPLSGKIIPYKFVEYSYGKSQLNVERNNQIVKVEVTLKNCNDTLCVFDGDVATWEKVIVP